LIRTKSSAASAGQAGVDQTAPDIQSGSVCAHEGGGGAAHAVFQRVPAAVLLSDDGRHGGVHAAERGGDGDAGGQRGDERGADHADRAGEGAAVCDPGGGPDGGGRRRRRHLRVGGYGARHHHPGVHGVRPPQLFDDEEPADAPRSARAEEVLQVVPQAHPPQRDQVNAVDG